MDFTSEIFRLREEGPTSDIFKSILKKFAPRQAKMIQLNERYKASGAGVPIFDRFFKDGSKVNNKVNNDFFSEIVDIKTGYFAGSPFSYLYDRNREERIYESAMKRMSRFFVANNLADVDSETTKNAAVCGYAARLLYIGLDGEERVASLPPYECIILSLESISKPEFALRVQVVDTDKGSRRKIEFYDAAGVRVFYELKKNYFEEAEEEAADHVFGVCPLFGVPNNEELLSDVERVEALIDAYDRTVSDVNSEIESFRLAYMLFKGGIIDEETLTAAQRTGAFNVPDGGEIEYLVKQMNDVIVENHLNRLEQNIYRFSKTPDLSDQAFAGNASGVALKYKLFPLESKCKTFERKFNSAALHMFEGLCNSWRVRGETFDYLDFYVEFKRNFPLDLLNEAQIQQMLKGIVSEQTRLSQASFIDDPLFEMEQIEQEAMNSVIPSIDLDSGAEDLPPTESRADQFVTE